MCGSPNLIAAYRVLLRLVMPRHPSCARIRLAEPSGLDTNLALLRCNLFSSQTMQLSKNKPHLREENRRDAFSFQVSRPCHLKWWACLESNRGPRPYQGRALTN